MQFMRNWDKPGTELIKVYFWGDDSMAFSCPSFNVARPWKYNSAVNEYFVETSTKQTIRQTELQRQQEVVDKGESLQQIILEPARTRMITKNVISIILAWEKH